MAAFTADRLREWPNAPIPALDGATPLAAVAAGRVAEVRALVPDEPDEALWATLPLDR